MGIIAAVHTLTIKTLRYVHTNHGEMFFFQYEIIINVLVSSFRFIGIPMLSTAIIIIFTVPPYEG